MRQRGTLFQDRDEHVSCHGNPYLRLHRVLALAEETLDSQMLLDPFEEQLELPALAIERRDQRRAEREIVAQKHHALAGLGLSHHDATQYGGVVGLRVEPGENTGLIAQDVRGYPIHVLGVAALELHVALRTGNEERLRLRYGKQARKVDVAAVEEIERTGLEIDQIERVDIVQLAVAEVDEARDVAVQIEQRVQLDGRLLGSKRCPRKHRQKQIDGGRIERVDGSFQVHAQRLLGIHWTSHSHQALREVGIDLPRARRVGIGQRVARNDVAAKAQVIEPMRLSAKIDLDVSQRLAPRQLRERHSEKLIETREVVHLVFASMRGHTTAKRAQRQMRHELSEHKFAVMHGRARAGVAKPRNIAARRSNRDQKLVRVYATKSLTYNRSS
jgi:hypothetical protein